MNNQIKTNLAKTLSFWGFRISLAVLLSGLAVIIVNNFLHISDYITYIGQQLTKTSFTLLIETFIGVMLFEALLSANSEK